MKKHSLLRNTLTPETITLKMTSRDAWVSGRQHLCGFCGNGFPADSRYSNGNKLCPSLSRHISLLIWSRINTTFCSQPGENSWRLNFTYRYIDDVLSISNPEFENYLGQMYPVELEIKDTTESNTSASYLDLILSIGRDGQLHTFICDKRDASTSQIFRSWVAIFQPRPPIESLFRSLYDMPGLAPRITVLFWGRRDFQISFSNRDTSRNAWNRHWGSFMADTGILSNKMKFHSHEC